MHDILEYIHNEFPDSYISNESLYIKLDNEAIYCQVYGDDLVVRYIEASRGLFNETTFNLLDAADPNYDISIYINHINSLLNKTFKFLSERQYDNPE